MGGAAESGLIRSLTGPRDVLGEGPCWSASEQRLYWFDIRARRLRALEADGCIVTRDLPFRPSAAVARSAGGLLMATDQGLASFDPGSGRAQLVFPIELPPGFRTNDGKVDPLGRFWWSTMDDAGGERPGCIFITHPDGRTERALEGVHIANAISFSVEGATLYLADSLRQTIWAYETADLSRRRVFARTTGAVFPDGAAVDAEGFLWNAHWGGWRIVRYAPDGSIDRVVEMPVEQPTSCAFGGADLGTLYVTSASDGLPAGARADQPLAGALFAFEPGVCGQPLPAFGSPP